MSWTSRPRGTPGRGRPPLRSLLRFASLEPPSCTVRVHARDPRLARVIATRPSRHGTNVQSAAEAIVYSRPAAEHARASALRPQGRVRGHLTRPLACPGADAGAPRLR